MLYKTVIYFILYIVLSVSSECDQGCQKFRVKRGKYFSNPPSRFYNQPPMSVPIQGPFSYTPPPFTNDKPSYPGRRPYKVSKIPTSYNNQGLGDDDLANIVKYMSSQDLEKLVEFVQSKDQGYNKYKERHNTNEYNRPFKRENKYNSHIIHENPTSNKEGIDFLNYVTEPTYDSFLKSHEAGDNFDNRPALQRTPNDISSLSAAQGYVSSDGPVSFAIRNNKENIESKPTYLNFFTVQEPQLIQADINKDKYTLYQDNEKVQGPGVYSHSKNAFFIESNEEEKLPPPANMRVEDYEASYTNNVPKVAESYDVKNFGDLPLMDYISKLHDVSSYHVPHYTVTDSKPSEAKAPTTHTSFTSSSSSTLLKPSPAAAGITEPMYEPAPPASAAAGQSDAHLKATKIWSYKSRGAAYILHDDGSLSPERSRPKAYKKT